MLTQGMSPSASAARSAPVSTAITPGAASAAATSIDRIRALACGDRTNAARAAPGTSQSSA